MKRLFLTSLITTICLLAHAELKVHFTFETGSSIVGSHTGVLHNGAQLTTMGGLPTLSLGSGNGYFNMGASVGEVIATLDDFTISTNVYVPGTTPLTDNGNFIYTFANSTDIANDANGCIFLSAKDMRYTICRTNYQAEESVGIWSQFPKGTWHTLTYRQSNNYGELFVDGALIAAGSISINPSDLGTTPYNFIGRPCYRGDVYLKDACYNDFRIYDEAIDDDAIAELTRNLDALNLGIYEEQVDRCMSSTTLEATYDNDIDLPARGDNDVIIIWESSDESIISPSGQVIRPTYGNGTAHVTLTAIFLKGDITKQKEFIVQVPAYEQDDQSIVETDFTNLELKGHLDNLMTNLYLPTRGEAGANITWTSSRPEILSNEGELLQPSIHRATRLTLTATVGMRDFTLSRTYDICVAPKKQMAYYLFAYFNGNAQWQEQICFALSTDGYNYTPLNNGNPIISSADIALKQAVRDPHILRGEDGYFYMVVTDMRSSEGWSSNDGMVLLRSADMVNWTHTAIDFPTRWPERFDRDALTQVWAPQTIYDPEEGKYMVYYAIGESGKNYITYYSYANEDFTDLTEPQVLYDHGGMNTIDADIVWHDGKYHMFFKTEGQGNGIQKATAKTLRGEWTPEYKNRQQTSVAVEGSGVFKKIDSDEWVLMYDCYTSGMYEYCTSTDLSNFTKVCNSANTDIFTPRHGTTIAITAEEAQRLLDKWPSDGLELTEWTDVTGVLKSPSFDGNSSKGWTYSSNAVGQNLNFDAMEFWNGYFNLHQTIKLPNGKYRLSVQAFYNTSGNESVYLYANGNDQPITRRNDEGAEYDGTGECEAIEIDGEVRYVPSNMYTGHFCFFQGLYDNTLEVEVTNNQLTIGLYCPSYTWENWCMFDNFRLAYWGTPTAVESIALSQTSLSVNEGENATLIATPLPEDAMDYGIVWSSSNPEIATIDHDGVVRGYKEGTTTITAQTADGSGVSASCKVTVKALNGQWADVTEAYITNPGFDGNSNAGWYYESNAGSKAVSEGAMEFWNGRFNIHQTFNVPNGKYRLSAQAYYRTGEFWNTHSNYETDNEQITAYIYANESKQKLASICSEYLSYGGLGRYQIYAIASSDTEERHYYPDDMIAGAYCFAQGMYNNSVMVDVTDGTLTIGLICEEHSSSNWCMFDNFKLEYYGSLIPVTSITLSSSSLTLGCNESATLTATIEPDNATYKTLVWTSDNPQVASVDQHGVVTTYSNGTATITATTKGENGMSASCKVTVTSQGITAGAILINEIQSANIDMFVDPSFNYGGWIELYNTSDTPINLNYMHISDDETNLTKYNLGLRGTLPAKGYHVLWFDHYHHKYAPSQIDFKLDFDGGTIYLSDNQGNLIASQAYPVAVPRTAYARTTNGGDTWGYTASPTPGKSNTTSAFASERLMAPVVDKDACLFTDPFTFNVEIPTGTTLRYTTDGTTPTLTNGFTSTEGAFAVEYTTTYRFCLYQEGKLPSQVVTRSYIYRDKDYALPVISVVTDPINLYDDSLGVYVQGVNGRTGNGQSSPCNWNMDWDRPVNFEYITPEGGMAVNQEVDFAMCGGWSRAWSPHSFKLKAGKIYEGLNSIDYPFFADKPYLKHKTLQIRNGGNDTKCRIKDAALQEIVHRSGMDIDGQSTQPVIHFINGQYMGMLNMREPNNKHFAYANWGIDTDEMDQFEMSPDSGYVQMEGDREAFLEWYALSANAADEATYEEIRNLVDIDEYINYMAVEFYLGGTDWPQNNIKGFRPRTEGGRFRFVLFDLDGTFATTSPFYTFEGKQTHKFDYIYDLGGHLTEEIEMVTIFLNMLQNDSFRKQFIDTYCLVAGSVFEPERCNAIIDEMAARIAPTLAFEGRSPYETSNALKNSLSYRQGSMISSLVNYERMQLSYDTQLQVSITSNITDAPLRLNDMKIPTSRFEGALFSPITLKAEPVAGYRFAGWANASETTTQSTSIITRGTTWEYYDKGSLDGSDWQSTSYTAPSWSVGSAPLGYFTSDASNGRGYNTTLDYGSDANAKRPTYYLRTSFNLSDAPTANDLFVLNYTVDDGMIVYVNGTEAARYLMPDGTVTYSTYASSYASSNPDNGSINLDASLFQKGANVIAIEVHNCDNKSSDIFFDAELTHTSTSTATAHIVCEEAEYTLPSESNLALTALYEPLTEEELVAMQSIPVRINEISADNSIYVNEYYKKNDWIELFNTTNEPVDVTGMYLSDNLNKPTKYQIEGDSETNTVIAPHSYLIIWADKLDALTQLHTSFKLAAEGGYVTLTSADQTWSDVLYYEPHLGTESVGLYPDGSTDVYIMSTPTIAQANTINSYATWLEQPNGETEIAPVHTDENKILLNYSEHTLHIYSTEGTWVNLTIYAVTGRVCAQSIANLTDGHTAVSLTTLPEGVYVVSATSSNGETQTMKLKVE